MAVTMVKVILTQILHFCNIGSSFSVKLNLACRGHGLDGGVEVEADSSFSERTACLSSFPFLVTHSSLTYVDSFLGYSAFMHPLGSVLIQTLCDLLEKEGGPDLEITRLLTRLNYQVAYNFESRGKLLGGKKQMPDLSLTFAATKFIDEPRRSRKSSIG
uniref:Peptidase C14 caspase domain-containing protein n=1 Tax=Cyprinus carpio TaxID=7962 RepID=A0A8C1RRC6_CYPCA